MPLVWRPTGIAGDHLDPRQGQIELFRGNLRQRRKNALPQLHLARENGGGALGIDADPGIEPTVVLQASGQPFLSSRKPRIEREGNHDGPKSDGKFATIESGAVHVRVLPLACAARSTARIMR